VGNGRTCFGKEDDEMKKLLMVCAYFYPECGGAEIYAHNIAKGLVKKGVKVTVLCSTKKEK